MAPHGGLDWQRDDRLGRRGLKHRREILRRCTESDTHANTFSDPNRDGYTHTNSNTHGYADGDRYSDGNCNSNAECYT